MTLETWKPSRGEFQGYNMFSKILPNEGNQMKTIKKTIPRRTFEFDAAVIKNKPSKTSKPLNIYYIRF